MGYFNGTFENCDRFETIAITVVESTKTRNKYSKCEYFEIS